jgi:endonuclease YncB( thermonuclease family)
VIRRRRSRTGWLVVLALLLIVTAAAGIPYLIASEDAQRPDADPQITTLSLPPGTEFDDLQRAEVQEVIDGDTIDVRLNGRTVRVRYYGIDTPERGDRCYREAADRNETLIGGTVLLLPDARLEDSNGRLLRYIFLSDGTSVDATLVAEGFALAWRDDGRYRDQLISLERQAQTAGRGCLWSSTDS